MRKSVNGLSKLAQNEMHLPLFTKSIFLFCNKKRNTIKALYWHRNGFCLWMKKLSEEKFPWPQTEEEVYQISTKRLFWLLKGIDFFQEHTEKQYKII